MESKRVSVFFKCWIGDVTPAIADVQIIPRNIISKNIVEKACDIIGDDRDIMYPYIEYLTADNNKKRVDNEIGIIWEMGFMVRNCYGQKCIIRHKDNWFIVVSEPDDLLIIGTPWLWLFDITLNLYREYFTVHHYHDEKIKIYSTKDEAEGDNNTQTAIVPLR